LKKMKEITDADPEKYFVANQFVNPHNPEIHYQQTGPEIWHDMNGEIDVLWLVWAAAAHSRGWGRF
jgi:cysteine synthase A